MSNKDIHPILFDGYAVHCALGEKARQRTSPENVSDVLDAVVSVMLDDAPVAVVNQYYYRVDACKADNRNSPFCICWHNEGTGPYASRASWPQTDNPIIWRRVVVTGVKS